MASESGTVLDDVAARSREMEVLAQVSERFGRSLTGALESARTSGQGLDAVLGSVGAKLATALGSGAVSALGSGLTSLLQGAGQDLSRSLSLASFGGALGFAKGGVFSGGIPVQPFAAGGVVASPTYFPTATGLGLMGEAGPEAVMPLARGADGRLGVRGGAAAPGTTINVTVQASDLDSFKRSESQLSAALARAVARGRRAT